MTECVCYIQQGAKYVIRINLILHYIIIIIAWHLRHELLNTYSYTTPKKKQQPLDVSNEQD